MKHLIILFFIVVKIFMTYGVYNVVLYQGFTIDYAILCCIVFYISMVLAKLTTIPSHITGFIGFLMAAWAFTSFAGMFPHSAFYFWVYGYDNTFLFG